NVMLVIAKPVKVLSTHGAEVTTIAASGFAGDTESNQITTVEVGEGATFGLPGQGFRVITGVGIGGTGIAVGRNRRGSGNIVEGRRLADGRLQGCGIEVPYWASDMLIADNQVVSANVGVYLSFEEPGGSLFGGPVTIARNVVSGNSLWGIYALGRSVTITGNI